MLSESDVARRRRCAEGARVVLIGTSGLGSMVMRGKMMQSVLAQTVSEHGVKSSYVSVSDPTNSTAGGGRDSAMLEGHFDQIGGPSVCIVLKYSVAWVGAACRRRGAVVLVDSIDNYRAFKRGTLTNEHWAAMDAILVQTRAHASLLASWGHTAVVLPHSHGNLRQWSVASGVRPSIRGVGFVVSASPASNRCCDAECCALTSCVGSTGPKEHAGAGGNARHRERVLQGQRDPVRGRVQGRIAPHAQGLQRHGANNTVQARAPPAPPRSYLPTIHHQPIWSESSRPAEQPDGSTHR